MKGLFDLLTEYLDNCRALNYSNYTIRTIHHNVRVFLKWIWDKYKVNKAEELRSIHLKAYQNHLAQKRTSRGLHLKPRSINKLIECLKGFLVYMARESYVSPRMTDQIQYVKVPDLLPTSVLNHKQMKKLIGCIDEQTPEGYRDRTMLELMYTNGVRAGEVLGLDVDGIDFEAATAIVRGKGSKERVVPIGRTALKYLETYLASIRPYMMGSESCKAVFIGRNGKRLRYHVLRRIIKAHAKKAGLPDNITAHTFRRSCTTELLKGGAGMYHVKEILGHESLDTLKHYAKLTITDLKKTHAKCHPREREIVQEENDKNDFDSRDD